MATQTFTIESVTDPTGAVVGHVDIVFNDANLQVSAVVATTTAAMSAVYQVGLQGQPLHTGTVVVNGTDTFNLPKGVTLQQNPLTAPAGTRLHSILPVGSTFDVEWSPA